MTGLFFGVLLDSYRRFCDGNISKSVGGVTERRVGQTQTEYKESTVWCSWEER